MLTLTKSHEISKIKASHYFGAYTKIAEHTIIKEHGNMEKWIDIKVYIKGSFKRLKCTILEFTPKSHKVNKINTSHDFGVYPKIVEICKRKEEKYERYRRI